MQDLYRYLSEVHVHVLDCAGRVDLATGRERLLQGRLAEQSPADGVAKLLVDFRNTEWESVDDHMQLSRVNGEEFELRAGNQRVRAAILRSGRTGQVAHDEQWFVSPEAALSWLRATG